MNEQTCDILSAREKRLMLTAIVITGCFVFLWSPYLIMMVIEMVMGVPAPTGWDQFCSTLTLINSAINPFLLYAFDKRICANVNQLLGIKSSKTSNSNASNDVASNHNSRNSKSSIV
ncbi:hypothetical protein HDU91_001013, partial [Kappamyces sp. JEL0680]